MPFVSGDNNERLGALRRAEQMNKNKQLMRDFPQLFFIDAERNGDSQPNTFRVKSEVERWPNKESSLGIV